MRIFNACFGVVVLSSSLLSQAAETDDQHQREYQRDCQVIDGAVVCLSLADELAKLAPEEKGERLYSEADQRHGPLMGYGSPGYGDSQSRFIAIMTDANGNQQRREVRLKYLENTPDGNKRLIIFDKPKDLKRHALLTVSHKEGYDEQWLYDPEARQVKRLLSNNAFTPFAGTEIAFEDISSQDVAKYDYRFVGNQGCGEMQCYIINRIPKDRYSGYSRLETWIDQEDYLVRKIDYYERDNRLLKSLSLTDYQQYEGKHWRASEMLMQNHQSGGSTKLIWSEYQFNTGLSDNDFSLNSLRNVN